MAFIMLFTGEMKNKYLSRISIALLLIFVQVVGCAGPSNQAQISPTPQLPVGNVPANQSKEYALNVGSTVVIEFADLAGSITEFAGQPGQVNLVVTKRTMGVDKESATADLESFSVEPQQKGNTITLGLGKNARPGRGADYKITTPPNTSIKVTGGNGNISLNGLIGDVDLNGQSLNVLLNDIHGAMTIQSDTGSIKITDGTGPANIQSRTSSVDLNRVTGPSMQVTSGANTTAKDSGAAAAATFRISKGDLTLTRFSAQTLSANVPDGQIRINESTAQQTDLQTQDGLINLFRVNAGKLQATTTSGDLAMDQVQGSFNIKTDKGAVSLTEAAAAAFSIAAGIGSVVFYGALPVFGEHSIKTTSGDISVFVVKESAFRLDATTRGTITIQPPFVLNSADKTGGHLRGVINQGTILVALTSTSGNILISSEQQ